MQFPWFIRRFQKRVLSQKNTSSLFELSFSSFRSIFLLPSSDLLSVFLKKLKFNLNKNITFQKVMIFHLYVVTAYRKCTISGFYPQLFLSVCLVDFKAFVALVSICCKCLLTQEFGIRDFFQIFKSWTIFNLFSQKTVSVSASKFIFLMKGTTAVMAGFQPCTGVAFCHYFQNSNIIFGYFPLIFSCMILGNSHGHTGQYDFIDEQVQHQKK